MPRVKDVAAVAGVSMGTVSNVLNGTVQVKEGTERKVWAAIEELGYRRNEIARQLRAGSSRTVGVVLLDVTNPYFAEIFRGAEDLLIERGYVAFLGNSGHDATREQRLLADFKRHQAGGVIVAPVGLSVEGIGASGMPAVLIDRESRDGFDAVRGDDLAGGRLAAHHLLSQGHRRIAFVGGHADLSQIAARVRGAEESVEAFSARGEHVELQKFHTAGLGVPSGREGAKWLFNMDKGRRPTAVFAANDLVAIGLLQGVMEAGGRVPEDVAIIGYDDIPFAGAAAVPLSSIRQPAREMGRAAAELLLARLEQSGEPAELLEDGERQPQAREFQPRLVARRSTEASAPRP